MLQLCFYAEAIEAATGVLPEHMHIELGSGRTETIRTADVLAYWRRLRGQLAKLLNDDVPVLVAASIVIETRFRVWGSVDEKDQVSRGSFNEGESMDAVTASSAEALGALVGEVDTVLYLDADVVDALSGVTARRMGQLPGLRVGSGVYAFRPDGRWCAVVSRSERGQVDDRLFQHSLTPGSDVWAALMTLNVGWDGASVVGRTVPLYQRGDGVRLAGGTGDGRHRCSGRYGNRGRVELQGPVRSHDQRRPRIWAGPGGGS